VKSFNFLGTVFSFSLQKSSLIIGFAFSVDSHFTVKIADLELGVLRSKDAHDPVAHSELSSFSGHHAELVSAFSDPNVVVVEELLANWMAPEVSQQKCQKPNIFLIFTIGYCKSTISTGF
jgi:hypothetical protein